LAQRQSGGGGLAAPAGRRYGRGGRWKEPVTTLNYRREALPSGTKRLGFGRDTVRPCFHAQGDQRFRFPQRARAAFRAM